MTIVIDVLLGIAVIMLTVLVRQINRSVTSLMQLEARRHGWPPMPRPIPPPPESPPVNPADLRAAIDRRAVTLRAEIDQVIADVAALRQGR